MALSTSKHERFYSTSGTDSDKISTAKLAELKDLWDKDAANGGNIDLLNHPNLGPIIYQLQQMQRSALTKTKLHFQGLVRLVLLL